MENLQAVAQVGTQGCPGLLLALVDVLGDEEQFPGIAHRQWWHERGSFFSELVQRNFPPGTYGNMFVNYDPHPGASTAWRSSWEDVFENKTVLVVGHPFAQAATATGSEAGNGALPLMFGLSDAASQRQVTSVSHEILLQFASARRPPFSKARQVLALREGLLPLRSSVRWFALRDSVLAAVESMHVDLVAVAWGPHGKALTAELACGGVQALDVGRLLWSMHSQELVNGPGVQQR